MRLPWRRRKEEQSPPTPADEAIELSALQRDHARERRREFQHFANRMRRMREVNHLAEAFDRAFKEGR